MRKLVVAACLLVSLRANACPDANLIPDWFGYAFLGGLAGGYAYGTYYFASRDTSGDKQDNGYQVDDLTFNGLVGTVTAMGSIESFANDHPGTGVVLGGLTLVHGAMAVHAARNLTVRMPAIDHGLVPWIGGVVFVGDTLAFASELPAHHERAFGVFEATLHAPVAIGLGYLAYAEARDGNGGPALLLGGAAALSAAFAYDGLSIALADHPVPKLDLLGTDVMPTIVDDGKEIGAGLGTAGTW